MKYFTSQWWASGGENATALFERYESYLSTIRSSLPAALVDLEANHTLHDSEVKRVTCDFEKGTVKVLLHGWDRNLQHTVHYALEFAEVSAFEQVLPQQEYVEAELGDLGYWECELFGTTIEVRMLFVSGAEFRVCFKGFTFSHARPQT